ncbi:MAG: ABC-2 transporter permease [Eggerthellaceae bacterium]|nr:ABC-2 transporter permease [Eggerthellaceae bacterium]
MSAMIKSDFIIMRSGLIQLGLLCALVGVVMAVLTESVMTGAAAMAAMTPFMCLFSLCAYDEMNGWERFRLTLPISRRSVAYGRYVSLALITAACCAASLVLAALIVGVMALLPDAMAIPALSLAENPPEAIVCATLMAASLVFAAAAVALPLIMRLGLTKGTRLVPVIMVLLLAFGIWLMGDSGLLDSLFPDATMEGLLTNAGLMFGLIVGAVFCGVLILYAASAAVAARIYEDRQF